MSHATPFITQHSGFLTALAESGYSASQAIALTSCVEAFELSLLGSAVSDPVAAECQNTSLPEQGTNPTSSDHSPLRECGLCVFPSGSSLLVDSSLSPPLSVQNVEHEFMSPELSQGGAK
ncbi:MULTISPECIES: hypothetical protein [Brucellaceae]|uniref:hypothetical protein n=1 Tax=Brucellaceae TaxID=118882 RepID=UPI0012EC5B04|nr:MULTISPECIES: hypothetical protein [Brucellaceae]MBX8824733.1 hypothetical protein [Ochrobactrum sp. SFR4]